LVSKEESCPRSLVPVSRRHVVTARREEQQFGRCRRSAPRSVRARARSGGWLISSATGVESVRGWFKQADVDSGESPGTTTAEHARIRQLEQELREVKRANAILKSSAVFFAAELDRPHR
jgi:transposase-like protein